MNSIQFLLSNFLLVSVGCIYFNDNRNNIDGLPTPPKVFYGGFKPMVFNLLYNAQKPSTVLSGTRPFFYKKSINRRKNASNRHGLAAHRQYQQPLLPLPYSSTHLRVPPPLPSPDLRTAATSIPLHPLHTSHQYRSDANTNIIFRNPTGRRANSRYDTSRDAPASGSTFISAPRQPNETPLKLARAASVHALTSGSHHTRLSRILHTNRQTKQSLQRLRDALTQSHGGARTRHVTDSTRHVTQHFSTLPTNRPDVIQPYFHAGVLPLQSTSRKLRAHELPLFPPLV